MLRCWLVDFYINITTLVTIRHLSTFYQLDDIWKRCINMLYKKINTYLHVLKLKFFINYQLLPIFQKMTMWCAFSLPFTKLVLAYILRGNMEEYVFNHNTGHHFAIVLGVTGCPSQSLIIGGFMCTCIFVPCLFCRFVSGESETFYISF